MPPNAKRIHPSWEEINAFPTPLTSGECALAHFLDDNLPSGWRIYVQPFLNGDRPDLVIMNPAVGLMIFEVKDWSPGLYRRDERGRFFVNDGHTHHHIPSPVGQVDRYRENLINLYLPQIGEAVDHNSKNLSAFRIGLYLHRMDSDAARKLIDTNSRACSVFGWDSLKSDQLTSVVPDAYRSTSLSMKPGWADDIEAWLRPPFHSLEQAKGLTINADKQRIARSTPGQHHRLRGVAGSGKTVVIAQRAANLASAGKNVLIVSFNITLWHYIRDLVARVRLNFPWGNLTFMHFHGLIGSFLEENDAPWPQTDDSFDEAPRKVMALLKAGRNKKGRAYDAILIDEGQDFKAEWYECLCAFLTKHNEALIAFDEQQNVYGRDLSWLKVKPARPFVTKTHVLKDSYRLPHKAIALVNQFATEFVAEPDALPMIPSPEPIQAQLFEPSLFWFEVPDFDTAQMRAHTAYNWLLSAKKAAPSDIVILVPTHDDGWQMTQGFLAQGVKVNHVFEETGDEAPKRHKHAFWMGDGRLKMSTIHSFKGWDLQNVVIVTPDDSFNAQPQLDKLIYTAITRTRGNLFVLNRYSKYSEFGKHALWQREWI